jgi:hypothetical protein
MDKNKSQLGNVSPGPNKASSWDKFIAAYERCWGESLENDDNKSRHALESYAGPTDNTGKCGQFHSILKTRREKSSAKKWLRHLTKLP